MTDLSPSAILAHNEKNPMISMLAGPASCFPKFSSVFLKFAGKLRQAGGKQETAENLGIFNGGGKSASYRQAGGYRLVAASPL